MKLDNTNFFKYFIFHPSSEMLDKGDRVKALVRSVMLGIFTLGLCHVVCALAFRSYKPVEGSTPSSKLFTKTVFQ